MKRLLVFVSTIGLAATMTFVGCGKNSDGTSPAPTVGFLGQNCVYGQVVASDGTCLNTTGCTNLGANYGFDPRVNQCVAGSQIGGGFLQTGSGDYPFGAPLNITNAGVLQQMVSDFTGQCTVHWLLGGPNYSMVTQAAFVDIHMSSQTQQIVSVTIGAGASSPQLGYPYMPMSFQAQVYPINSSAGMQLVANGSAGSCNWNAVGANGLNIIVNQGTFSTATSMAATLTYKGSQFATATIQYY